MTIRLTLGDLLKQADVHALVHTVNCVGVMGQGIDLSVKNKRLGKLMLITLPVSQH